MIKYIIMSMSVIAQVVIGYLLGTALACSIDKIVEQDKQIDSLSNRLNNIKESQPQSGVIYYSSDSATLQLNGDTLVLVEDSNGLLYE